MVISCFSRGDDACDIAALGVNDEQQPPARRSDNVIADFADGMRIVEKVKGAGVVKRLTCLVKTDAVFLLVGDGFC